MNSFRRTYGRYLKLLVGWVVLGGVLVLTGCDAGGAATAVPPTAVPPTATPMPVADTPTVAAEPGIVADFYDHAPDYRWIAGQVRQDGECWIVTYVSLALDHAPDQYNNQMTLLPGPNWNPIDFSPGAWVIVEGQPQPGTDPAPGCTAHGFEVTRMRLNPKTPKAGDS